MKKTLHIALSIWLLLATAFAQSHAQKTPEEEVIRISTELVQLDVVVVGKNGSVVKGLNKSDFEIYENGKKQQPSFFEFVDASKSRNPAATPANAVDQSAAPQPPTAADVRRIFAFIIDDLTIGYEDLVSVRQMLANFMDNSMQTGDLVAIVRTVSGKGVLQQFTTDKSLLTRAVAALTPVTHQYSAFNNPDPPKLDPQQSLAGGIGVQGTTSEPDGGVPNLDSQLDDTNKTLRAFMSLGTAGFIIDSMKELPGRKSLVLISGGLPVFSANSGTETSSISNFLNNLTDRATRAGVAISTMDVRGLKAFSGVAGFDDTPARGALGVPVSGQRTTSSIMTDPRGTGGGFGRIPDETLFGDKNPFDQLEGHEGLRVLAAATGGISVLDKNNFSEGLQKIVSAGDGYYLIAYTPFDTKFNGEFRKVDVRVKGDGLKVYNRRGYIAREDKVASTTPTKQEQLLAAIKSPLARRELDLETTLLYKPAAQNRGAIGIHVIIDPKRLNFEQVEGKHQVDLDVAGFVFDQLGKLRGGFGDQISASLKSEQYDDVIKGGFSYVANTVLPPGGYQIRIAVRDNKTGNIGTLSRYVEVPDLSKGRLAASSLLLAGVPAGEMKAEKPTPVSADRRISRKQDLRYAVMIFNARQKDNRPQVRTQLIISQNGQMMFKQPEESVTSSGKDQSQLIKWGQLGLSSVKPGRYTMTLVITDELAEKKAQTVTRSMDFVVVD
jgi:VWFA-related protein